MDNSVNTANSAFLDRFGAYLGLERGLSANTLAAYSTDVRHLLDWLEQEGIRVEDVEEGDLHTFLAMLRDFGILYTTD